MKDLLNSYRNWKVGIEIGEAYNTDAGFDCAIEEWHNHIKECEEEVLGLKRILEELKAEAAEAEQIKYDMLLNSTDRAKARSKHWASKRKQQQFSLPCSVELLSNDNLTTEKALVKPTKREQLGRVKDGEPASIKCWQKKEAQLEAAEVLFQQGDERLFDTMTQMVKAINKSGSKSENVSSQDVDCQS